MTEHDALVALTVLHRRGERDTEDEDGFDITVACCMTCAKDGWPCETRQLIDAALNDDKD